MRRSKGEFFEKLFDEIFRPRATTLPEHDSELAQEQERIYGYLLRTHLQNLPPGKELQPSQSLVGCTSILGLYMHYIYHDAETFFVVRNAW